MSDYIVDGIKSELDNLTWEFEEHNEKFNLDLNSNLIEFSKCHSEFTITPNEWLRSKHKNGKIHEPGLIAILCFLSSVINVKVRFYDIGALFGYFSSIAKTLFDNCDCFLVEGNPYSSDCIKKISPQFDRFEVKNVVLGSEEKSTRYLVDVFQFIDLSEHTIRYKIRKNIKNFIKSTLNRFNSNYQKQELLICEVRQVTLPMIFEENISPTVEIFKLDTEGYQCKFLPPFIDEFCSRNPIVLLELDDQRRMSRFGKTNNEMLQLFLDRDYQAYWLNHRSPELIKQVTQITSEEDFNSLLLLIPNVILDNLKR